MRDNPEKYSGWLRVHCFSKKFEKMAREATDVSLRGLKGSNKSRFDSFSVRDSALIISYITFQPRANLYLHIRPELDRNSASVDLIRE